MKKILWLLAVVALVSGLASCSSGEPPSEPYSCDAQCSSNLSAACGDECSVENGSAVPLPTDYADVTDDPLPDYTDEPSYEPDPPIGKVTYRVTGNSSTSLITYTTEDGSIEQNTRARLPWKKQVGGDGDFYQVSAQDTDGAGKITCQIIGPDGEVLSKHTSRGPYSIASCSSA